MTEGRGTIVVFTGLPGTGKSTLARVLAERHGLLLLDKDRVREALYGPNHVLYTRDQDDQVVECLLASARWWLGAGQGRCVLLDGRTWLRAEAVEQLLGWAREHAIELLVVRCLCEAALARQRCERDRAQGRHPARNRDAALHAELASLGDPWARVDLELDTGAISPEEALHDLEQALDRTGRCWRGA